MSMKTKTRHWKSSISDGNWTSTQVSQGRGLRMIRSLAKRRKARLGIDKSEPKPRYWVNVGRFYACYYVESREFLTHME